MVLADGRNTMKTFRSATANGFEPACRANVPARLQGRGRWRAVRNALFRAGPRLRWFSRVMPLRRGFLQ